MKRQPARLGYRRLALALILLLGALLRFSGLSSLPPGLYHDEAYNGLDALAWLQGESFPQFHEGWELYAQEAHPNGLPTPTRWPVFFEGNYGREPLHIYLMALSIHLLGPTPLAVRAVPATAGVVAIGATYLAAAALFRQGDRRQQQVIPLLAAFTLAIMLPAVHFSRFGLRLMLFLPLATLAVTCFWRGLTDERGRLGVWWALSGVFIGAGLYSYAAARLFPLLFVLVVALRWQRDRAAWRRERGAFLLLVVVALATALPLLIYFARNPYFFVFRLAYVANRGKGTVPDKPWLTWLLNIGRTVQGLLIYGETHLRHNLPGRPFLDPVQAAAFVAGLGVSLRQWATPRAQFLLLWLGVMLLPTILSGDAPHFGRMIGAAPPAAMLISLGAYQVWQGWLSPWAARQRLPALPLALGAMALGVSLTLTVRDYFRRYANHPQLAADFYQPDWELGLDAASQPAGALLYLTPPQAEMATIYFALAGQTERLRSYNGDETLTPLGAPAAPAVYYVRPAAQAAQTALIATFPEATSQSGNGYQRLTVGPGPRTPADNLTDQAFGPGLALVGWTVIEAGPQVGPHELAVELFWQATAPLPRAYTAYVHLLDGAGQIVAQLDRPPAGYPTFDWRPGEIIRDRYSLSLPPTLPPGTYQLRTGFYYLPTLEALGNPIQLHSLHRPAP